MSYPHSNSIVFSHALLRLSNPKKGLVISRRFSYSLSFRLVTLRAIGVVT